MGISDAAAGLVPALLAPLCHFAEVPEGHEMWSRPVSLREGVEMKAMAVKSPRELKAFVVRIDLTTPGIGFTATERDPRWGEPMPDYTNKVVLIDTKRERTADFMARRRAAGVPLAVAVNSAPWYPWDCGAAYRSTYGAFHSWNVSDGMELSHGKSPAHGAFFVIYRDGKAEIAPSVPPSRTNDVAFALCGFSILVNGGKPMLPGRAWGSEGKVQPPRTVFGLDAARRTLVLLVVDGRQPGWSVGAYKDDVFGMLRAEGVADAVEMDGGGSSTLVVYDAQNGKPWVLNRPSEKGGRRNALNFGVFFKPVQ